MNERERERERERGKKEKERSGRNEETVEKDLHFPFCVHTYPIAYIRYIKKREKVS